MKPKTYTQPNYDSVEDMISFLEIGSYWCEIKQQWEYIKGYWYVCFNYRDDDSDDASAYEPDLKTALHKCCEERIKKGL
jgi:hypothetical protein